MYAFDVPDCLTSFPNSNKNNSIRILNCTWKTKFAGSEFRKIFFKKLLIFIFIKKSCTVQKVNECRCSLIFLYSSIINRKRYCNRNFYRLFFTDLHGLGILDSKKHVNTYVYLSVRVSVYPSLRVPPLYYKKYRRYA